MKPLAPSRPGRDLALQVGAVALFVLAWYLFSLTPMAGQADMPGPVESVAALVALAGTAEFWTALGLTVLTWALALAISIVIGVPLGLAIGRNRRAFDSSKLVIDFLRTLPALALIPVCILVFGANIAMAVVIGVITAVWPLIVQSIAAGQHADPVLHRVARSFRISPLERIRFVLAPDALAFIWPGLRLAVTASLLSTIAAQLIGGAPGLGLEILDTQIADNAPNLYAYVLTSCFLGLAINAGLLLLQRRLLWWHPSMRGAD